MIELERDERQIVRELCSMSGDMVPSATAEGRMGKVWVPQRDNPSFCLIHSGNFVYLTGICPKGEQALELKEILIKNCSQDFITPSDERWGEWLEETFSGSCRIMSRYAMRTDENYFSEEALANYLKSIPEGIRIKKIDSGLFEKAMDSEWSREICSNFETREDFIHYGSGFAALDGERLVSGCLAYEISEEMLVVKVATHKEYKCRGLALACSAGLILSCLKQKIFPTWDADNIPAAGLAEKLGYIFEKEYQVYRLGNLENGLY
nr:GNAT family N-acetyltransferase [uncultured Clostridium sp.]